MASDDNENDEYHAQVPITDLWAECWRLKNDMGWTGRKIAETKGKSDSLISERLKWHEKLPIEIKEKVSSKLLDEDHIRAFFDNLLAPETLLLWLDSKKAQIEFMNQILDRHRGSTAGVKPTVIS